MTHSTNRGAETSTTTTTDAPLPVQPFKQHRTAFAVLGIVLAGWIGFLLITYFTAVRPQHEARTAREATTSVVK